MYPRQKPLNALQLFRMYCLLLNVCKKKNSSLHLFYCIFSNGRLKFNMGENGKRKPSEIVS